MLPPEALTDAQRAIALGGALALLVFGLFNRRQRRDANVLSQPRVIHVPTSTLPLLGNALDAIRHEATFHSWISDRCLEFHGEPWLLTIPGELPTIVCSSSDAIEEVAITQFDKFPKGQYQIDLVGPYFGLGVAASDGARWPHQRKIATKFFSTSSFRNVERASRHIDTQARRGETVDLKRLFHDFTIDTFAEIGLGFELGCIGRDAPHPFQEALDAAATVISLRFRRPEWFWKWQSWLNIGYEAVLAKCMTTVTDWLRDVIHTSVQQSLHKLEKGQDADVKSVVELFIEASQDNKEGLQEDDIVEFILTFVVGARETTADTLCSLFYMLHLHPDVEARVREEMAKKVPADVLNQRTAYLTTEHLQGLVYREAVIKETFASILPGRSRFARGQRVALPIYAIGRNPEIWGDDAAFFRPDRWIHPESGDLHQVPATKFFNFSAGPRTCVGMQFAMLELRILVANLLNRYKFAIDPATNDGSYGMSATLVMRDPLEARTAPASRA